MSSRKFLIHIMLAALLLLVLGSSVAVAASQPSKAGFDRLANRLANQELVPSNQKQTNQALAKLRALLPPNDPGRRFRYRYIYCDFAFSNDAKAGFAYANRGLVEASKAGDASAAANFELCRGYYNGLLTTPRAELADYNAAIVIARRLQDPRLLGDALSARGNIESLLGDQSKALNDFLDADQQYRSINLTTAVEVNQLNIGISYRRMGLYDKAAQYLLQARKSALRRANIDTEFAAAIQLGYLYSAQKRFAEAITAHRRAVVLAKKLGDRESMGDARLGLADVLNERGDYALVLKTLVLAKADFIAVGDHSEDGMIYLYSGLAYTGLGQYRRASRVLDLAERYLQHGHNLRYLQMLYTARAATYKAMHQPLLALAAYQQVLSAQQSLLQMAQAQFTTWMHYQQVAQKRKAEALLLRTTAANNRQRLASLERTRKWQGLSLLFGALLVLGLLSLMVRQISKTRQLRGIAHTDTLTGAASRWQTDRLLIKEIQQARAKSYELAVLSIDLDHFKQVNDQHGHAVGDEVLRRVVKSCQSVLRKGEKIGRVGGEEFLIVLSDIPLEAATRVAERLRTDIEGLTLDEVVPGLRITISIGVAALRLPDEDVQSLLQRADAALYQAKNLGRNTVQVDAGKAADGLTDDGRPAGSQAS